MAVKIPRVGPIPLSLHGAFCILCLSLLPGRSAAADTPDDSSKGAARVTGGFETDFNSRYVWRGIALTDAPVRQHSLWVMASDFTLTAWGNENLGRADHRGLSEVDLILSYAREWRKASFEPALQVYFYPNQQDAPTTGEASLKVSYPVGRLRAFTSHSFDVMRYHGSYFGDVGLSYEHELSPRSSWESSVSLGWASSRFNEVYIGSSKAALNVASLDVGFTYQATKLWHVRAHLGATALLDETLRRQVKDPTIINVGLAVGTDF